MQHLFFVDFWVERLRFNFDFTASSSPSSSSSSSPSSSPSSPSSPSSSLSSSLSEPPSSPSSLIADFLLELELLGLFTTSPSSSPSESGGGGGGNSSSSLSDMMIQRMQGGCSFDFAVDLKRWDDQTPTACVEICWVFRNKFHCLED